MARSPLRYIALTAGLIALALAVGSAAQAQSKCDSAKLKEMGKKVFCKMKVYSKAAKKGEAPDATKLQKCEDKFDLKCGKAESKGDCTKIGNCASLEDAADSAVGALLAASPGGAFCGCLPGSLL